MIAVSKEILLLAKRSIAFDINIVEHLNKKMSQIDSRLYLFAYYQPKILPEDIDERGCFDIAIFNMYGLLWDCGKMMQQQLLGSINDGRPSFVDQMLGRDNRQICKELCSIIYNVRTCLCHNNSDKFFYNQETRKRCNEYLNNAAGGSILLNKRNELQWKNVCQDLFIRCIRFTNIIENFLDQLIQESDPEKKNSFVQYWINSISKWYQTDMELINHVLAQRYNLKISTSSLRKKVCNKHTVSNWVASAWEKRNKDLSLENSREYYSNYIDICLAKIPQIINEKNCPTPALPLKVISRATGDSITFGI